MKKQQTIIYGGAFNPPTLAHVAILKACIGYAEQHDAEVWIVPSGDRLDKTIPTPREMRVAYVEAMIRDTDGPESAVRILPTELDRLYAVETYDTVVELKEQYPDREFIFVFGADSTQTMATWKHGEELLRDLPMIVVERVGSEINPLARKATRLKVVTPTVSSTEVRARLATGQSTEGLVSPSVKSLLQ